MTTTLLAGPLCARHVAMLRAVAAGRAEVTWSRVPDLYVDGRCCTDHAASALLVRAGLITAGDPPRTCSDRRAAARLTDAGRVLLAAAPPTSRPGGMSLDSLRRVGSANTHHQE